jgi:hypothetical protein
MDIPYAIKHNEKYLKNNIEKIREIIKIIQPMKILKYENV